MLPHSHVPMIYLGCPLSGSTSYGHISIFKEAFLYTATTVVWKIFIWNYFIVENDPENNFCGLPIPTKIF